MKQKIILFLWGTLLAIIIGLICSHIYIDTYQGNPAYWDTSYLEPLGWKGFLLGFTLTEISVIIRIIILSIKNKGGGDTNEN